MEMNIYAIAGFIITFVMGLINLHLRIQRNTMKVDELEKDVVEMKAIKEDVIEVKSLLREMKAANVVDMNYIKKTLEQHDNKIND